MGKKTTSCDEYVCFSFPNVISKRVSNPVNSYLVPA